MQAGHINISVNQNKQSFYCTEYQGPTKKGHALVFLEQVEKIMKSKLTYDLNHCDKFSGMSNDELIKFLSITSKKVHDAYFENRAIKAEVESEWAILRKIVEEDEIRNMYLKIEDYSHPKFQLLNLDLIKEIFFYLTNRDKQAFSLTSKIFLIHIKARFKNLDLTLSSKEFIEKRKDLYCALTIFARFHIFPFKTTENNAWYRDLIKSTTKPNKGDYFSLSDVYYYPLNSISRKELRASRISSSEVIDLFSRIQIYSSWHSIFFKFLLFIRRNRRIKTATETPELFHKAINECKDITLIELLLHCRAVPAPSQAIEVGIFAAQEGNDTVISMLQQGNLMLVDTKKSDKYTMLHIACWQGHEHVVKFLVSSGASLNSLTEDSCTPLVCAMQKGHMKLLPLLLPSTSAGRRKFPPLHQATLSLDLKVVERLLQSDKRYGIHTAEKDELGRQPLHLAAEQGNIALVELLFQYNAPINSQDIKGLTPLHYACAAEIENASMVELLLANGADINLASKKNLLPFHMAESNNHTRILALLSSVKQIEGF